MENFNHKNTDKPIGKWSAFRDRFPNWTQEDLNQLDAKFDALCELLGIEFEMTYMSDGSIWGDRLKKVEAEYKGTNETNHD